MNLVTNKIILITGGAGFIGANLVRKLFKNNEIHLFLKPTSDIWRIKDLIKKIVIHHTDLLNNKQLSRTVNKIKPQIIYHLAAHGSYPTQTNPMTMIQTNIVGTINLLLALNPINYLCFINTGSSSEYGFKKKPMSEEDSLKPTTFYAATKASTTYLCHVFAKTFQRPIITLRPFSVYGPYEEPTRLIPTVITKILKDESVSLTPQVSRRDFIYIDDVVNCYVNVPGVINKKLYGEVFNIGTGRQYSNKDVVKIISKLLNKKVKFQKGKYENRSWDTNFWVADISKAKKLLHWKTKYSLKEGLLKTIQWFTSYEQLKEIYY